MENTDNKNKRNEEAFKNSQPNPTNHSDLPTDLIDDLKKNKIDPLTEGTTHLGYDERAPRKKELDQDEHYDQDDK